MSSSLFYMPVQVVLDNSGAVLSGAKLYFYETGTSSPKVVYQDVDLNTAHAQPVVADAYGSFGAIWLDVSGGAYRVTLTRSDGTVRWTIDGVTAVGDSGGGGAIVYAQTDLELAAGVTPVDTSYEPGDVRRYGTVGNGTADDTTAIQNAFTGNPGGKVWFQATETYRTTSAVTVLTGTVVDARGAALTIGHTGTGYVLATNVYWTGGEFTGPAASWADGSICFLAAGTRNGAAVAPGRVSGITIMDVSITSFGDAAIELRYVTDCDIIRPRITNVAYIGVHGYCSSRIRVFEPYIDTMAGETYSGQQNAYGVAFSTDNTIPFDAVRDPVSSECEVSGGMIRNIPTWHALDTHSGSYIKFHGVSIYNCRRGAVLTNNGSVGPQNCVIDSCYYVNELSGLNSSGSEKISEAMWDIGVSDSSRSNENVISNNVIVNGGRALGAGGAIFVEYSSGCTIRGNTLRDCRNQGVYVGTRVRRLTVDSNTFIDVHGLGAGANGPSNVIHGVLFNADYFQDCTVTNNSFIVQNSVIDNYVLNSGVTIGNYGNRSVHIDNNTFDGVTTQVANAGLTPSRWNNITGGWAGFISTADQILYTAGFVVDTFVSLMYAKTGDSVTLRFGDVIGTAGTTTYAITTLPEFLKPLNPQLCLARVQNLGATTLGILEIATSGVMRFYPSAVATSGTGYAVNMGVNPFAVGTSIGHVTFNCTYTTRAAV